MQVPLEHSTAPVVTRRRLPAAEVLALREALDAELASASSALRDAAIRRACAVARSHGLSAAELIVEVKDAWATLPASHRRMNPEASVVIDRFVSGCIEEFYRA
jgi:hypothetical protein